MANIVQINYLYRDREKISDFIQEVALTDVAVEWDAQKSQINIIWDWEEESQVKKLLALIRGRFKDLIVTIDNEEYIEVDKAEQEEELGNLETFSEEPKIETTLKVNSETTSIPEMPSIEEKERTSGQKPEVDTNPKSESENVSKQMVSSEETTSISQGCENEVERKEDKPPPLTSEECEEALRELLGASNLSEYDFTSDAEKVAAKFCSDYEISSKIIERSLSTVCGVSSEAVLYQLLAMGTRKNSALIKLEIKTAFDKWLIQKNPEFKAKYHDEIKPVHLFNLFRRENRKF